MTDTTLTDAQIQSYALRAVSDHLAAHPSLCHVNVSPWRPDGRLRLQIHARLHHGLTGLMGWATSLGVDALQVHAYQCDRRDRLNLHAHGELRGLIRPGHGYHVQVDVWSGADELLDAGLVNGDTVKVSDLVVASAIGADTAVNGDLARALANLRRPGVPG